jgi:hypothetical protein
MFPESPFLRSTLDLFLGPAPWLPFKENSIFTNATGIGIPTTEFGNTESPDGYSTQGPDKKTTPVKIRAREKIWT